MEERRQFKRFKVMIPFRFIETNRNREGVGEITDISANGAGTLVTCERLELSEHLNMWLELPGMTEPLQVKATVTWLRRVVPGVYRTGVCFDRVDFMSIARVLNL